MRVVYSVMLVLAATLLGFSGFRRVRSAAVAAPAEKAVPMPAAPGGGRPAHVQLTSAPTEDDFPACAAAPDNSVWCSYVSYQHGAPVRMEEVKQGKFDSLVPRGNGDQIRLIHFTGREWSPPIDVTAPGLDVWRPAVGVDERGQVWVVWSQGRRGNWDLYARSYDRLANRFGGLRRLTRDPGSDINPILVGRPGSAGLWVVWQGWRGNHFDILAAPLEGRGNLHPLEVSNSPANNWNPTAASTPGGDLWIAWDTYARGNYDVMVRRMSGGKLLDPIPLAASPRFEARPSLVVDRKNRVWVAFEDADPNWGKDYGTRWEGQSGVPFYIERRILVRCLNEGRVQETKAPIPSFLVNTPYPLGPRRRESFPRLGLDGQGRVWLLYRRHPLPTGAGERWMSFATYYDGDRWSVPVLLPQSANLMDSRPGTAPLQEGGLLMVYPTDGRTGGTVTAKVNHLCATILAAPGQPGNPVLVSARVGGDGQVVEPVHPNESAEIRRIRSRRVTVGGKSYRFLRGEFHRHTEISSHRDQDGPFEELWRYGLDVARMDWLGPGDHDSGYGREYTWWLTQKQCDIYYHSPLFIPMYTYERSVVYPSGHRNVVFTRRGIRPLPRLGMGSDLFGTPQQGSPDIKNLYAYLRHFKGICASHTSATNMGTDWRDNDPKVEPVVEIYQGHRQSYEALNAPKTAKNAQDSIGGYQPAGYVWNALARGYRLGFESSSDHISTHLSYAIVLAEKPTRRGILEALQRRHSYGANDNIILAVTSSSHLMGDEFTTRFLPHLSIDIDGTAPIKRVDIVRQIDQSRPEYVYAAASGPEPGQRQVALSWTDLSARPGSINMYYVRLEQVDGKMAWASPIWIHYRP